MKSPAFALTAVALALTSLPSLAQVQALWRHTDGSNYLLVHDGETLTNSSFYRHVPAEWQISAKADLNGDGMQDIVWRNQTSGDVYVWLMQGSDVKSEGTLFAGISSNWQIVSAADFTGDGKADLLWRNTQTGQHALFQLNGLQIEQELPLPQVADLNWVPLHGGDFDGDGTADLFWRNTQTGQNYLLLIKNGQVVSDNFVFGVTDQNWQPTFGDFNGDRKTDIWWHHQTTGQNYLFTMDGYAIAQQSALPTVADLDWQIAGVADFDSNGTSDLVWRNKTTGQNVVVLLDEHQLKIKADYFLTTVADQNWQIGALLNNGVLNPSIANILDIGTGTSVLPFASSLLMGQGYYALQYIQNLAGGQATSAGTLYCGLILSGTNANKGSLTYDYKTTATGTELQLSYNQCQSYGQQTLNGQLLLVSTDNSDAESEQPPIDLNATLTDLEVTDNSADRDFAYAKFSGQIALQQSLTLDANEDPTDMALKIQADLAGQADGVGLELKDYNAEYDMAIDAEPATSTAKISGEVIRAGVSYQLSTPTPLQTVGDSLSAGHLKVASSQGTVDVEVQGSSLVFTLDLNGDGTAEMTETYPLNYFN